MLDTHARKFIEPTLYSISKKIASMGIKANQVTLFAFAIGIVGAIVLYFEYYILSVVLLWLSGVFDALDGNVARIRNEQSALGAQLDIISDRVVENAYFWALALTHRESVFAIMFLITMAFLSMTIFLTTGIISKNETKKSFYYQAGLMERTEGFIATTIMILFNRHLKILAYAYAFLILITAIQRLIETIKINR